MCPFSCLRLAAWLSYVPLRTRRRLAGRNGTFPSASLAPGLAVGAQVERAPLAAVDEGILQLTDFETPDPVGYFFGKRRLGIDLRDLYGNLINGKEGRRGTIRSGVGDPRQAQIGVRFRF